LDDTVYYRWISSDDTKGSDDTILRTEVNATLQYEESMEGGDGGGGYMKDGGGGGPGSKQEDGWVHGVAEGEV
jgi:hypothetical protein